MLHGLIIWKALSKDKHKYFKYLGLYRHKSDTNEIKEMISLLKIYL